LRDGLRRGPFVLRDGLRRGPFVLRDGLRRGPFVLRDGLSCVRYMQSKPFLPWENVNRRRRPETPASQNGFEMRLASDGALDCEGHGRRLES